MKKALFMMSLLLSLGMFSACSNDGEMDIIGDGEFLITDSTLIPDDGVILHPVDASELMDNKGYSVISKFFDSELPKGVRSGSFFVDSDQDKCYVINSLEEFKNIYCGDKEIPKIDFGRWTLVIGQMIMPDALCPVLRQNLEFRDKKCQLSLFVPNNDGIDFKPQYLYHWAFYPKFNAEGISVSFVKERSGLQFVENLQGHLDYNKDIDRWRFWYHSENNLTEVYFLMEIPEEYKVENQNVSLSGYRFDVGDEKAPEGCRTFYYLYLTKIEITD